MKIIIDARLYGSENGGLGRYVSNLITNLSRLDKSNNYIVLLRSKYYTRINLPSNWQKIKIDVRHYSFLEQLVVPWVLSWQRPDLVHFPHFNVPLLYFGRYVVTIHDLLMHQFRRNTTTTLPWLVFMIKRFGYWLSFKKAVNGALAIIVPSFFVKKELLAKYHIQPSRVSFVYEGVDTHLRLHDPKTIKTAVNDLAKKKFVLYVGNAYPHKNLSIFKSVFEKLPNLLVVMVIPRNVFMERLRRLFELEIKAGKVILLNHLTDSELVFLYRKATTFVFPSLAEGFGLPGLEAMSLGTPLVASDIPVFHEVYREIPFYFDPKKSDELVTAIKKVNKLSFQQRQQWTKRAKELARHYSWSTLAKKTLEIYSSI